MSGFLRLSGSTATGSLNSTTVTISGGDVAPILPGMMIWFGSRDVADGPGYIITAVVRTDASNGTLTLASGLQSAQTSQPWIVDLSQAGNATGYANFALSRVIQAQTEYLGLGTTVDATTKQIVLNKATAGAMSQILWEIAGADQFRIAQRTISGVEHLAIQSSNDGGVNWVDAILVRRTDGRIQFQVAPFLYASGSAAVQARADNFYAIESRRASNDTNPGAISLEKSRGTIAAPAVIQAGDGIASVAGRAWDGSAWTVGAQFRFDCVTFASAGDFTSQFQLQLRNGTSLSTVMTALPGGNVGIGTTTPTTRLHVFGGDATIERTGADWSILNMRAAAGALMGLYFQTGTSTRWNLVAEQSAQTGSNAGANFAINRFADNGGFIAAALLINRAAGHVTPGQDNAQTLGSAGLRWSTVFAGTGTINTSDARQKVKRGGFSDAELDAWADVQPLVYRWKDSVERKGDAARQHAGYIAQEIAAAFEAHGLNAGDYGLWCEDTVTKTVKRTVTKPVQKTHKVSTEVVDVEIRDGKPVQVRKTVEREEPEIEMVEVRDEAGLVVRDGDGKPLMHPVPVMENREVEENEEVPDGTRLGLRYDQCAVFEAAWARREIARLRARIAALEA